MALTTPVHGTVYSPPPRSVQQPALPSAAGHAAAAATLRCLSATPHLQHPQSNNGGYRAYSAMIHYCSAGYSPCDSMTLPPPTPLPLLTPSSGPLRPPTYFPPTYSQPGPSYKLQTTTEKCFANKSQEAANALLSLQREPVVMPACSQPHPSEPDLSQDLLQENARGISDSSLNVSEAPCSHPDLHMGSLSPPVLSHCNSEGVSPPTLTSLPHGAHAYGPTTPFPTPAIGSLLTHFQPTNYSYLPFTPHELFGGSYICHICGKSYVRPATLRSHVKSHSGEKPYQCSICHKSFTQATNLTAHLRTHSGEKPFTCRVCHRGFSQSSSVTTHMRTHSGDRPYKCNVCNKGFADSSTLTKHYRTHTGEKPYQCKICEARFSQSGNLNRHMRTHRHFPMESSSK